MGDLVGVPVGEKVVVGPELTFCLKVGEIVGTVTFSWAATMAAVIAMITDSICTSGCWIVTICTSPTSTRSVCCVPGVLGVFYVCFRVLSAITDPTQLP